MVPSANQRALLALLIDAPFYSAQATADFVNIDDLVGHFINTGWRSGFDPSSTFRSSRFLNAVPGLREAAVNPFLHYLFVVLGEDVLAEAFAGLGNEDIRKLRVHFDADWYIVNNPGDEANLGDPFVHYMSFGWREMRDPSPYFSTSSYLDLNPDVRDAGMNPFRHWVLFGIEEGRSSGKTRSSALDSWEGLHVGQQAILGRLASMEYYRFQVANAGCNRGSPLPERLSSDETDTADNTSSFHAQRYVAAHPDVHKKGQVPFLNYLFEVIGEDALRELFLAQTPQVIQAILEQFDTAWYLYSYPDVELSGEDALMHYMTVGWRDKRDPSPEFSTRAYLLRYPDIVEADVNPFLHWIAFGKEEGRYGASSATNFRNRFYAPSITAILINDEVNPLTPDCIASVTRQSYPDLDFLVVGSPLSGACRAALANDADARSGISFNSLPEDGVVPWWGLLERAVEHARGDLLWFVSGSGVYHFEFVARLASSFADGSVQLGFGRVLAENDADYTVSQDKLARRMENWLRHVSTPAALWFPDQLRSPQLANVQHSFLWRRRKLSESVWRGAGDYRYLSFWYLYLHMASGGQVTTSRDALIRIPSATPASSALSDDEGFREDVVRLAAEVQSFWSVSSAALSNSRRISPTKRHVLIVSHGIFAGGAENLPIQLANELARRGIIVSMLIFRIEVNAEMRATLDPGVSIYEADWVREYGRDRFVRDIGCSLIHSHGVISEMFFFGHGAEALSVPYVATLHGSYESSPSSELPEPLIAEIVRRVDLFVYTADKNLGPLLRHDVRPQQLIKMINAMPIDEAPFPCSRAELGIADDALVFTLIARGVAEKGWSTAINAFKSIQKRNPHRSMHLCLVGEGDEPERLKPLHADDPSISFLGFQLRIHGLYRMTDVAIVPTRFAGESFPLCIIQALQVAVPVVATDIGEIASMLEADGVTGGIVVRGSKIDDEQFDARFADAMESLIDDEHRRRLASGARVLARRYDMGDFTDQYITVYENVLSRFAASRPALQAEPVQRDTVDAQS